MGCYPLKNKSKICKICDRYKTIIKDNKCEYCNDNNDLILWYIHNFKIINKISIFQIDQSDTVKSILENMYSKKHHNFYIDTDYIKNNWY